MSNSRIRLGYKGRCLKQDKVTFTLNNIVSLFIVYKLSRSSKAIRTDCRLKDCLFRAAETTKNADSDKYSYSGYGIGFDSPPPFSISNFEIFLEFI